MGKNPCSSLITELLSVEGSITGIKYRSQGKGPLSFYAFPTWKMNQTSSPSPLSVESINPLSQQAGILNGYCLCSYIIRFIGRAMRNPLRTFVSRI